MTRPLATALHDRLAEMLGVTLQPVVIDALAHQLTEVVGDWLNERSRDEVFDSSAEHAVKRLAHVARENVTHNGSHR